jgi:hypothetical protein
MHQATDVTQFGISHLSQVLSQVLRPVRHTLIPVDYMFSAPLIPFYRFDLPFLPQLCFPGRTQSATQSVFTTAFWNYLKMLMSRKSLVISLCGGISRNPMTLTCYRPGKLMHISGKSSPATCQQGVRSQKTVH